jgi:hypothetical protein
MVLKSSSKNPLISRFHLRNTMKNSEGSILTASIHSYDEEDVNSLNVDFAILTEQRTKMNQNRSCRGAYNFDDLKVELGDGNEIPTMFILPIPSPYIEAPSPQDLEDTCVESNGNTSPGNISNLRFRWSNIKSQFSFTKTINQENCIDDVDKVNRQSQSDISPMTSDGYCHSMEECDDNDGTSLLHGRTIHKMSTFFNSTISLTTTSTAKKQHRVPIGDAEDQYEYLISDKNDNCHDWLHRQLAFDLEYLEDIEISSATGYESSIISEEPYWTLHPEDITFDIPPPPVSLQPKNSRENVHLFSDEDFMETDGSIGNESQSLLDRHLPTKPPNEPPTDDDSFDLQKDSWQDFDAGIRTSYGSNRSNKKHYHKMAIVRNRFGRYNTSREMRRRSSSSSSSSRISKQGRRRNAHRNPPTLLGRQFSTNLSTVTERPSEEEATSSYIPTPMSCKNRQFFASYESDSFSNQSKEGTLETCSSKDSST